MPQDDTASEVQVVEDPARNRFEAYANGELVGTAEYIPLPGKVIATHTETSKQHRGKGLGARLVAGMLEQLRADGRLVQPLCPYVTAYLREHPEYADVVDTTTPH